MSIITGYTNVLGNDIGTLFASGNSGITTGYKNVLGNDIGTLFAKKSVVLNGSSLDITSGLFWCITSANLGVAYATSSAIYIRQ